MTDIIVNAVKIGSDTTLQYKQNPKRSGSKAHARYELYQAATSLTEYLEICEDGGFSKYGKADLRYDEEKGHLILLEDGVMINQTESQADADDAAEEDTEELDEEIETNEDAEEAESLEEDFEELEETEIE